LGIDIEEAVKTAGASGPPNLPDGVSVYAATHPRPERSETGVFAIVMSFAAFTSAMIVRQGASPDWRHFELPRLLYANTFILLTSSFTLGRGSNRLRSIAGLSASAIIESKKIYSEGMSWLQVTLALGGLFLAGQVLAWRALAGQGLFLSTNPSSSFFYVFTAMHGVHLLGGVAGLIYMIRKLAKTRGTAKTTGLRALSVYWHFMDGLWLYLFALLLVRT
jgi:cytochrome c oxidase subunit 3